MSSYPLEEKVDPRIKRTRALLGQALTDVLAEKNFSSVTVQDITEKAGVNRTTMYLHFPDKYALLDYNITQLFRQELEKRTLSACHYTPENLDSLILTVAEFIQEYTAHCESRQTDPQFEALVEMAVKRQVQELVQAWGEKTAFSTDPKSAGIAASWAIYGLSVEWFHDKKRPSVEDFSRRISPMINAILGVLEPA